MIRHLTVGIIQLFNQNLGWVENHQLHFKVLLDLSERLEQKVNLLFCCQNQKQTASFFQVTFLITQMEATFRP